MGLRIAAIATACMLVAACGADEPTRRSSQGSGADKAASPPRSTIYFLTDEGTAPLGVRRAVRGRPGALTARLALEQLLAGPTADEGAAGVTTALPEAARIRSLRVELRATGSDAFVDLSGLPNADDADAVLKVRVMTQVARTLIGLSDVARVWLRADGRAWGLWDQQGNIRDDPIDYERLRGFFHICTAEPGTEAVPGDCFTALP
jgi:spore germination protein GerM